MDDKEKQVKKNNWTSSLLIYVRRYYGRRVTRYDTFGCERSVK